MRQLTVGDLIRANVPGRFWRVRLSAVPSHLEYVPQVRRYLEKFADTMMADGVGLFLWSKQNSTGKTSLAVIVLKEALRLGKLAYFTRADELKDALVRGEEFEDKVSVAERVRAVDLLVLDDLNKEYKTSSGYAESSIESLMRDRAQHLRTTVVTSNLSPKKVADVYSPDLAALLQETMIPIEIVGHDFRKVRALELQELLRPESRYGGL